MKAYLGSAVLAGVDDATLFFVIKSCATEINN